MKIKFILLPLALNFLFFLANAQSSVIGFWEVTSVKVGDEVMTPVAKWFRNNADGTFESGNGWTQNSIGTWMFDAGTSEFLPENTNGIKDEFGPFNVSFSGDEMTWFRQEEGADVYVHLVRIDKMPMGPADHIQGLWSLVKAESAGKDITSEFDPETKQYIFIRPDRRYRLRNPDASFSNGYWHMDGHQPIYTLINYDRAVPYISYSVSFENDGLIMESQDEKKLIFTYTRINQFPE